MERNSLNSQGYKLESQIREAYGRVTYSQTCHDKFINRVVNEYSRAMKSHFRKFGNQMSGSGNHLCNYASLLA